MVIATAMKRSGAPKHPIAQTDDVNHDDSKHYLPISEVKFKCQPRALINNNHLTKSSGTPINNDENRQTI